MMHISFELCNGIAICLTENNTRKRKIIIFHVSFPNSCTTRKLFIPKKNTSLYLFYCQWFNCSHFQMNTYLTVIHRVVCLGRFLSFLVAIPRCPSR